MSVPQQLFLFLRSALAALLLRPQRRTPAQAGQPEAAPTLGAFGLLASQGDPHRR